MRDAAALRGWILAGMPVPAEAPIRKDDRWPCTYFHLQVRDISIRAECQGCASWASETSIGGPTGLSVRPSIDRLSLWMVGHAVIGGMNPKAAGEAFDEAVSESEQVRCWAEEVIVNGRDEKHSGPVIGSVVDRERLQQGQRYGWAFSTAGVWLDPAQAPA